MTTGPEAELTLRAAGYRCFGVSLEQWLSPAGGSDILSTSQALAELEASGKKAEKEAAR